MVANWGLGVVGMEVGTLWEYPSCLGQVLGNSMGASWMLEDVLEGRMGQAWE